VLIRVFFYILNQGNGSRVLRQPPLLISAITDKGDVQQTYRHWNDKGKSVVQS
jgi:hypothetical protein